MSAYHKVRAVACTYLLLTCAVCGAEEKSALEGSWKIISYLHAKNQVRYETEGYMMFGKEHWLHLIFFNRDERAMDFSEAHHGTYQITGRDTLNLDVDLELHMDPRREFQETAVWYGPVDNIKGAKYRIDGEKVIIDFPSSSQIVLQRIE